MEDYVREYLDSFDQKLPELRGHVIGREAEAVKTFGHRIKGSGATYGFAAISELGAALEDAARKVIENAERREARIAKARAEGHLPPAPETPVDRATPSRLPAIGSGAEATVCYALHEGDDYVAVVGENRKLVLFPLEEVPEMTRGRGVILQRYKDGGLSDAKTFRRDEGLSWSAGPGRVRTETALADWFAKRAHAGRLPPKGFPTSKKFGV